MPASGTPPELYKGRQPKWLRKKTWPGSREKAWWCRMCSQWATCEHIKSKKHQSKRHWIDESNWSPTSSEWSTPSEPAAALALANEAADASPADPAGHQVPGDGVPADWVEALIFRIAGLDQRIQALEEELRAWREGWDWSCVHGWESSGSS